MHKFSANFLVDLPIAEKPAPTLVGARTKKEPTPKGQPISFSICLPRIISLKSAFIKVSG